MSYVILAPSSKCRKDAQQSVRAGIKLESRYEGSDKNVLHFGYTIKYVFTLDDPCLVLAGDCPEKDQSCVAADGSNVITTTTTIDNTECGRKLSILFWSIILGVWINFCF